MQPQKFHSVSSGLDVESLLGVGFIIFNVVAVWNFQNPLHFFDGIISANNGLFLSFGNHSGNHALATHLQICADALSESNAHDKCDAWRDEIVRSINNTIIVKFLKSSLGQNLSRRSDKSDLEP